MAGIIGEGSIKYWVFRVGGWAWRERCGGWKCGGGDVEGCVE
jgi:hypothetical protein